MEYDGFLGSNIFDHIFSFILIKKTFFFFFLFLIFLNEAIGILCLSSISWSPPLVQKHPGNCEIRQRVGFKKREEILIINYDTSIKYILNYYFWMIDRNRTASIGWSSPLTPSVQGGLFKEIWCMHYYSTLYGTQCK